MAIIHPYWCCDCCSEVPWSICNQCHEEEVAKARREQMEADASLVEGLIGGLTYGDRASLLKSVANAIRKAWEDEHA